MRIERLYARAFGPCTDLVLDFWGAAGALHVVYGPNEAGKSTLLRAIKAMLFGIEQQSKDNFLHEHSRMRIGALLSRADGKTLEFLRRKGHKKIFLAMDDRTALSDDALLQFCGSLDEKTVTSMYFVSHEDLHAGGRDILGDGGEVGPLLFEAGTGIHDLRKKVEELDKAAGELFKPQAVNPVINKAVREYNEAHDAVRKLSADSEEWAQLTRALEAARAGEKQLRADRDAVDRDLVRLRRIHQNLPSIVERSDWMEKLAGLAAIPDLSDASRAERIEAERRMLLADSHRKRALQEVEELAKQRDAIEIPQVLLERIDIVESLHADMGGYHDAARDIPRRQEERDREAAVVAACLRDLRPATAVEDARGVLDELRARVADVARLIKQRVQVEADGAAAAEKAREAERELAERKAALAALPPDVDALRLQTAIADVQGRGALEEQWSKAQREHARLARQVGAAAAALPLVAQLAPEAIQRLAAPTVESIERFEREADALRAGRQAEEQALARMETEARGGMQVLEQLRAGGDVPTTARLDESRARRDRGWGLVRAAYVERTQPPEQAAAAFDAGRPLPVAYEDSVRDADDVVDRMRRDAERVGKYEQVSARVEQVRADMAAARERLATLEARQAEHERAWTALWAPLGFPPLPPNEMRSWLQQRALLLAQVDQMSAAAEKEADLARQIALCRGLLDGALREMSLPPSLASESLQALLTRGRSLADGILESARSRQSLGAVVRDLEVRLEATRTGRAEAGSRLEAWRAAWRDAVAPFNRPADADPAEVEQALARTEQLGKALDNVDKARDRIQGMLDRMERYRGRVAALVAEVDPDLLGQAPTDAVSIVYRRAQEVKLLDERRRSLEKEIARQKKAAEGADEELGRCRVVLENLRQQARCETVDMLPAIEEQSERKRTLRRRLEERDRQLVQASSRPLEEVLAEARGQDADALPGRIQELEERREALERELNAAMEAVAQHRADLNAIDGSDRAAEKAQEAQEALARIRGAVDEYVRLKLSAELLRQAVEEYRVSNQGPLFKRAAELFPALTCGSFASLTSTFNDKDTAILVGVRGDGEQVTVKGMSDGTVDQLFLAVRLAAIERQQAVGEPLPVVLDDILVHFDDNRARATLAALAELSRVTQVLFFTHHQHLVELAEEAVPTEALRVHRLDGRRMEAAKVSVN